MLKIHWEISILQDIYNPMLDADPVLEQCFFKYITVIFLDNLFFSLFLSNIYMQNLQTDYQN